ncbi:MAG: DUF2628 domain-containing protein [Beijerinckiaceae bacterium]|nr:DUF2628 domain-containing protein [Beijerinckiaceae bacterium]MCI0734722.1 DUF2628 domain-containing protein [Beijerinckiaceae bacterium]
MAIYSVHLRGNDLRSIAGAAFVSQDFSWKAFLFGPLWLLSHRLWAGLALWVASYFLLFAASATLVSPGASLLIATALQILLGLEAGQLREAKIARQGYRLTGIIAAHSLDEAEAAFYSQNEAAGIQLEEIGPKLGTAASS